MMHREVVRSGSWRATRCGLRVVSLVFSVFTTGIVASISQGQTPSEPSESTTVVRVLAPASALPAYQSTNGARGSTPPEPHGAAATIESGDVATRSSEEIATALGNVAALGDSGVSWGPQWDLLGDSSVTTLDPSKPSVSLGVQYVSPGRLVRIQLRKNVAESNVSAARGEAAFGKAVLDPGLSNLSVKLRFESRLFAPYIVCKESACTDLKVDQIALRHGARFYGEFAAATATFKVQAKDQTAPGLAETGVPVAASVGLTYRVEGVMPGGAKFGSSALMLSPFVGAAVRALGGDFDAEKRRQLWDNSSSVFLGGEFGSFFQFGSLLFDARLTLLASTADRDAHIRGLTTIQFQLNTTFLLPWNVLGAKEEPES